MYCLLGGSNGKPDKTHPSRAPGCGDFGAPNPESEAARRRLAAMASKAQRAPTGWSLNGSFGEPHMGRFGLF